MQITGIKNGMVMQRGTDNTCEIRLFSDQPINAVSYSPSDGIHAAKLSLNDDGSYTLSGIFCGGPYTVEIGGQIFTDIYVGDVWVLAGQSNMQGIGRTSFSEFNNNNTIRALFMNNNWNTANHPLHERGTSPFAVHHEISNVTPSRVDPVRGVGPGLAFAKKLNRLTGVPQGLICCSHGGTTIEQWDPNLRDKGEHSLYGAMLLRCKQNGSNVRGVFWYQGCSASRGGDYLKFGDKTVELFNEMRRDFGKMVPIVQVQIAWTSWSQQDDLQSNIIWTSIREQQRTLSEKIQLVDTVSTVAYRLDDCIHLNAQSHQILGEDAADSMFSLLYGLGYDCLPAIRIASVKCYPDDFDDNQTRIVVTYDNVHGSLVSGSRVFGFDTSTTPKQAENSRVHDAYADGNRVILHVDINFNEINNFWLWYGWGRAAVCNVVDRKGRSIPAFGPLRLGDPN